MRTVAVLLVTKHMPAPLGNKNALGCKTSGRPTSYFPELGEKMVAWFLEKKKKGEWPTFIDFIITLPREQWFPVDKLAIYAKKHVEFRRPFKVCKDLACSVVAKKAINGEFDSRFAQFVCINNYGMRNEKQINQKIDAKVKTENVVNVEEFKKYEGIAKEFEEKLKKKIKYK